ncbi:MAG TPA: ankyrin repeat domain-containing protein [Aestuariivirga sp.]|nr:ankyrin repeat domain-containing protein [Aestuariivirga sp.]
MVQSKALLLATVFAVGLAFTPCALAGELHEAVKAGDISRVRTALAGGEDVNALDMDWTALHLATALGNTEIVQALIDGGANIEAKGEPADSHPLHLAAQNNESEIAQLLIKHGAKVNSRNSGDKTPLLIAAGHNHIEVGEILLKNGADPNETFSEYKDSPLHFASYAGNAAFVSLLIKHGAAVNAPSLRYGETPIFYAASHGNIEALKILVANGADVNVKDEKGATALSVATDPPTRAYLSSLGLKN